MQRLVDEDHGRPGPFLHHFDAKRVFADRHLPTGCWCQDSSKPSAMRVAVLLALVGVSAASSAYPSFADFGGKPYNVSYDKRAITLK
jgi:hypothetical protein